MTNDDRLSALIDGELSVGDTSTVLNLVMNDPALRKRWQHYHRIRDSMNGYVGASDDAYDINITQAISSAIDSGKFDQAESGDDFEQSTVVSIDRKTTSDTVDTDAGNLSNNRSKSAFWIWSSGLAVAATVAAVAIFGLNSGEVNDPASEVGGQTITGVDLPQTDSDGWDDQVEHRNLVWTQSGESVVSGDQARLNALLVRHGEFGSVSGMNGLSGYARFVSFDEPEG